MHQIIFYVILCDMPYFMKQNVLCRQNLSFNFIRRIHLHLCVLVYVSTSSYLTQVVFPFFPRTHLKLYLLVHLIFRRIHLTPNYCLCCSTSLLALLEFRYLGLTSLLMLKKHTTVLLNHGHIRNKFITLLLPFWYLISRVLSFAVLARQYFLGFYFCYFSRQI